MAEIDLWPAYAALMKLQEGTPEYDAAKQEWQGIAERERAAAAQRVGRLKGQRNIEIKDKGWRPPPRKPDNDSSAPA